MDQSWVKRPSVFPPYLWEFLFLSYNVRFYECVVCKEWGSALTTIFMLLFLNSFDASFKLTHWQTPSLCHHSNRWDIHGIGKMLPGCSSVGDWRKVSDLYLKTVCNHLHCSSLRKVYNKVAKFLQKRELLFICHAFNTEKNLISQWVSKLRDSDCRMHCRTDTV